MVVLKYDNYQSFALDTKDLATYDDIVNRFGNPSSDQNFSDYTYYTVFYKNIKVQERGITKTVFFKVDRNTDIIVGFRAILRQAVQEPPLK